MGMPEQTKPDLHIPPRRAFLNSTYAFLGPTVSTVAGILVVRYLGVSNLGKYSVALAFIPYFSVIANLGLDSILIRDIAKDPDRAGSLLANGIGLNLCLSFVAIVLCWVAVLFLPYPPVVRTLIRLYSFSLLFGFATLLSAVFQARVEVQYSTLASIAGRITFLAIVAVLVLLKAGLAAFILANLAWLAVQVLVLCAFLQRRVRLGVSADLQVWKYLFAESWPLALSAIFVTVYGRIDQLMLYSLAGAAPTGLYAASVKVAEVFNYIPVAYMATVFPILSQRFTNSAASFNRLYQNSFRYLGSIVVLIAVWITFSGERLLSLLFGGQYAAGSLALTILMWSEIWVFLGIVNQRVLVSSGLQKIDFVLTGASAAVNVGLNLILIPRYDIVGASIATFAAYGTGPLLGFLFRLTRPFSSSMFRGLAKPLVAAACTAVVSRFYLPASFLLSALQIGLVYIAALSVLGGITRDDTKLAMRVILES
jgi:O-antigen/teichoic acid export membrane protein